MAQRMVTDGKKEVTADELRAGGLYVLVEDEDGQEHLRHILRDPDDLPKVRIFPRELRNARKLQGGMRKRMDGYRPGIEVVISAGVDRLCASEDAEEIVMQFNLQRLQEGLSQTSSEATGSDDQTTKKESPISDSR